MPCRTDVCNRCHDYNCKCGNPSFEAKFSFDYEGALCDVLTLIEERAPHIMSDVDPATVKMWKMHESEEKEQIKAIALSKLTPRERRVLGLK